MWIKRNRRGQVPATVAGPDKGPFRDAARFDGAFPLGDDNSSPVLISPEGVGEVVAYVAAQRGDTRGYEVSAAIVLNGGASENQRMLEEFAVAGVTRAHIGPADEGETLEDLAARSAAGPPRF